MILPLWGQGCIVTYRGERTLGEAQGFFIDQQGCYRIKVWSRRWGYELAFAPTEVALLPVEIARGVYYDAEAAFIDRYDSAQIVTFMQAESGTENKLAAPPVTKMPLREFVKNAPEPRRVMQSVAKPTTPRRVLRRG